MWHTIVQIHSYQLKCIQFNAFNCIQFSGARSLPCLVFNKSHEMHHYIYLSGKHSVLH